MLYQSTARVSDGPLLIVHNDRAHLGECRLARIRDHRERRDDLLLDIPLRLLRRVRRGGIEELEKSLDDGVEVRDERLALDSLAKVDERRGGVCMDAARGVMRREGD